MVSEQSVSSRERFSATALLSVRGVTVRFGGIVALDGVSFEVADKQIAGLIGPNGAGKTTLFDCLSGLHRPDAGDIDFDGRSILQMPQHRIAEAGIGRTFQNVALFDRLSVLDNVTVGCHADSDSGFVASALRLPRAIAEEARITERARELIAFMDLERYLPVPAGRLPFPIRKRVEFARALAMRPKLLLLDEPAAGLNRDEVVVLEGQIRRVRERLNVAVLLVEHQLRLVMSVSDKVVAIDFGRILAVGTPGEVQRDGEVIRAYLGEAAAP